MLTIAELNPQDYQAWITELRDPVAAALKLQVSVAERLLRAATYEELLAVGAGLGALPADVPRLLRDTLVPMYSRLAPA